MTTYRISSIVLAVGMLAVATACDKSPTSPPVVVQPPIVTPIVPPNETPTFTAGLSPASVVPPVTGDEAIGTGTVTITLVVTRDNGGAIITARADFQVTLAGFPAGTALTMAHLHQATVGGTGPIVIDTGLGVGEVVLVDGSGSFSKTGVAVQPSIAQGLLTTPANYYFNVRSSENQSGMVRGQLVRN